MPISDKEQVQIAKKWWKEYGLYLIFTVIFFLLTSYGWNFWHYRSQRIKDNSSALYTQVMVAFDQHKMKEGEIFAKQLMDDYSRTQYASLAALFLAKEAVAKGDLKSAFDDLEFVIKKSPAKSMRQLARVRAARVLISMKEPRKALDLLSVTDDKSYEALTSEALGDAFMALSNQKEAKQAYLRAKSIAKERGEKLPLLKTKLQQF